MATKYDLKFEANSIGNDKCIIQGDNYRFTVITEKILRMEYSADGVFEDRPSQMVWNRDLGKVNFKSEIVNGILIIATKYFTARYKIDTRSKMQDTKCPVSCILDLVSGRVSGRVV